MRNKESIVSCHFLTIMTYAPTPKRLLWMLWHLEHKILSQRIEIVLLPHPEKKAVFIIQQPIPTTKLRKTPCGLEPFNVFYTGVT